MSFLKRLSRSSSGRCAFRTVASELAGSRRIGENPQEEALSVIQVIKSDRRTSWPHVLLRYDREPHALHHVEDVNLR